MRSTISSKMHDLNYFMALGRQLVAKVQKGMLTSIEHGLKALEVKFRDH